MNDAQRIADAGGIVDIGPECFALADGSVLSWRGENYVPQKPTLRVRIHNWWVRRRNARREEELYGSAIAAMGGFAGQRDAH